MYKTSTPINALTKNIIQSRATKQDYNQSNLKNNSRKSMCKSIYKYYESTLMHRVLCSNCKRPITLGFWTTLPSPFNLNTDTRCNSCQFMNQASLIRAFLLFTLAIIIGIIIGILILTIANPLTKESGIAYLFVLCLSIILQLYVQYFAFRMYFHFVRNPFKKKR
jgi:hypothetical protein